MTRWSSVHVQEWQGSDWLCAVLSVDVKHDLMSPLQASGLQFRHTDNINHWRSAMMEVGLPAVNHTLLSALYPMMHCSRSTARMHIPHYWRWFLMCSADLPSRDDRCVRQEEHAQSRLLHSRAEVWSRDDYNHILCFIADWSRVINHALWSLVLVCSCFVWDSPLRSTTSAGRSSSQVTLTSDLCVFKALDWLISIQKHCCRVYKVCDMFCRGGDQ